MYIDLGFPSHKYKAIYNMHVALNHAAMATIFQFGVDFFYNYKA